MTVSEQAFYAVCYVLLGVAAIVIGCSLTGCGGITLRPVQRDHAIRLAQVRALLATDDAHLSVAVSNTKEECDDLDGKVTAWTATGAGLGVLAGGSGLTALFTDSTPRYVTGGVGAGLAAFTAVATFLSTHYAQNYARRCAVNTGGL